MHEIRRRINEAMANLNPAMVMEGMSSQSLINIAAKDMDIMPIMRTGIVLIIFWSYPDHRPAIRINRIFRYISR